MIQFCFNFKTIKASKIGKPLFCNVLRGCLKYSWSNDQHSFLLVYSAVVLKGADKCRRIGIIAVGTYITAIDDCIIRYNIMVDSITVMPVNRCTFFYTERTRCEFGFTDQYMR